jgi:N-acetylmuramoyl-L-alanine amidase
MSAKKSPHTPYVYPGYLRRGKDAVSTKVTVPPRPKLPAKFRPRLSLVLVILGSIVVIIWWGHRQFAVKGTAVAAPANDTAHQVLAGETLQVISQKYRVAEQDLIRYNDLQTSQLTEGMVLDVAQKRPNEYIVKHTDTLQSISKRFGVGEDQLIQYNALNSTRLYEGQILFLYNASYSDVSQLPFFEENPTPEIEKEVAVEKDIRPNIIATPPPAIISIVQDNQPDRSFSRLASAGIAKDYAKAQVLLQNFDQYLSTQPSLSDTLKGYSIVLDPGHGGDDPGAIVMHHGNNRVSYLVEDEYNYDMALRIYALLKRHGAKVFLTVLAPNHLIRDNDNQYTFVNEKNEVYNTPSAANRPIGGKEGVQKRIAVAQPFLQGVSDNKQLWLSLHCDASVQSPLGLVALSNTPSTASIALAKQIIDENGRGKMIRDDFFVLKNNPVKTAILVEVRNLSIQKEAEILLQPSQREADANKIVSSLLHYVQSAD